jgi:hypothetical protein
MSDDVKRRCANCRHSAVEIGDPPCDGCKEWNRWAPVFETFDDGSGPRPVATLVPDPQITHGETKPRAPWGGAELLRASAGILRQAAQEFVAPEAPKSVPELLRAAAATYEERNLLYGDNYKHFGAVMAGLFPDGLTIRTPDEWTRFGLLFHIVSKASRYAINLTRGGHKDSAHDISVYAAMLEEMTK